MELIRKMEFKKDMEDEVINSEKNHTQGVKKLLQNRDFTSLFVGGLISDIGSYFAYIAVVFFAIAKTSHLPLKASAQAVAFISIMNIIPSLFIGPFAGVITDRFDRKKLMIFADSIGAITSFAYVFANSINHIYIIAFFASTPRLFFFPARGASIPMIVGPEDLVSANGLIQTLAQLSGLIGPAIAGILIGLFGIQFAFIVDGISYMVSALLILLIRQNLEPEGANIKITTKQVLTDLKEGFIIIKNDKILLFIMTSFTFVLMGAFVINPLFAFYLKTKFGLDETDFGFIISFSTVTGLFGAIMLTSKGQIHKKLTMILSSFLIIAISLGILGLAPSLPSPVIWLYIGMATVGFVNVLLNIPTSALMQTIIKNKHLGKVNGIMGTILALAQVIGAAIATYLAGFIPIDKIFLALSLFFFVITFFFYGVMVFFNLEAIAQAREEEAMAKINQEKALIKDEEKIDDLLYPIASKDVDGIFPVND